MYRPASLSFLAWILINPKNLRRFVAGPLLPFPMEYYYKCRGTSFTNLLIEESTNVLCDLDLAVGGHRYLGVISRDLSHLSGLTVRGEGKRAGSRPIRWVETRTRVPGSML